MLIAYLDEFGHVGPFIEPGHRRFGQHPVFGYAGYVLPAANVRAFGARFKRSRDQLFKTEIESSDSPGQWERKGSEFFTTGSIERRPEQERVFKGLIKVLRQEHGRLFYYGDEKPRGTVKQTGQSSDERTVEALRESINRLCTYAKRQDEELLLIMDSITEKNRQELVARMYAHIFSRSRDGAHDEMRRIIEAPLHIESKLNVGVQFADWICALMSRMTHWQLVEDSEFGWGSERFGEVLEGMFTYESKVHLLVGGDIYNDSVLRRGERGYRPGSVGNRARIPVGFYSALRRGALGDGSRD